jgi:hypothetical protein
MAILDSSTKTGISWVSESVALFKTAPRKWLLLALVYIGFFVMLPSTPGLQTFSFISILIWPAFLAIAMMLYRNADMQKQQNLSEVFENIKPKMSQLMALGGACLLYLVLVSFVLSGDMQSLPVLAANKAKMTEAEMIIFLQKMLPVLLKLTLLLIPLMMATWFAPMLIALNNYSLLKALKSSIAGSIQYMIALGAAWLLFTAGIAALIILAIIVGALVPVLGQILLFGCFLLATALMLAFQYVSYRDVFRAA